jgi:uncharacterized RDD family membrane protein YckC
MKKATFFQRALAELIDFIVFGALGFFLLHPGFMLLLVAYETFLVSQWGGYTVGKKIMGLKVVTVSGSSLDVKKAFIRAISKVLSFAVFFLGFIWMLWDPQSQTWHDKLADTNVVEA